VTGASDIVIGRGVLLSLGKATHLLDVHVCPHGIPNGADANEWIGDQTC
jgi:hypothetical protein